MAGASGGACDAQAGDRRLVVSWSIMVVAWPWAHGNPLVRPFAGALGDVRLQLQLFHVLHGRVRAQRPVAALLPAAVPRNRNAAGDTGPGGVGSWRRAADAVYVRPRNSVSVSGTCCSCCGCSFR